MCQVHSQAESGISNALPGRKWNSQTNTGIFSWGAPAVQNATAGASLTLRAFTETHWLKVRKALGM